MQNKQEWGVLGIPCRDTAQFAWPSDFTYTTFDRSRLHSYRGLIVFCESDYDENGKRVRRQDLYGVEAVRRFRTEGFTQPVIFISFFSRRQILQRKPVHEIIRTVGHRFIRLPADPDLLQKELQEAAPLTQLELKDILLMSCRPDDIAAAQIHNLRSLADKLQTNGDEYAAAALESCIRTIHALFQEPCEEFVEIFRKSFFPAGERTIEDAIDEVASRAAALIREHRKAGGQIFAEQQDKKWQVLLLDDELDKNSLLVKELLTKAGIKTRCVSNAEDAMRLLDEDDELRGKISVIVTDYRLNEKDEDGLSVQQRVQGYRFLRDVSERYYAKVISAVVYSGMPRQFLLDNLNNFNIKTEKYSKMDFRVNDPRAINYLVSRIAELGEQNYKAMLALPLGNAGWKKHLHKHYLNYRNLPGYEIAEREVCEFCTKWVTDFRSGKSPLSPMISGDSFEARKKDTEEQTTGRFIAYFKTRRLALFLYQFFTYRAEPDINSRIAGLLMPDGKKKANLKTISGYFSQVLGLSLTEFPLGATIEELHWFHDYLGSDFLSTYESYRTRLLASEKIAGEFVAGDRLLSGILEQDDFCVKGKRCDQLTFSKKTHNPYFFDKLDLGFCLEWLTEEAASMNESGMKEYQDMLLELKALWNIAGLGDRAGIYVLSAVRRAHRASAAIYIKKYDAFYNWRAGSLAEKEIKDALSLFLETQRPPEKIRHQVKQLEFFAILTECFKAVAGNEDISQLKHEDWLAVREMYGQNIKQQYETFYGAIGFHDNIDYSTVANSAGVSADSITETGAAAVKEMSEYDSDIRQMLGDVAAGDWEVRGGIVAGSNRVYQIVIVNFKADDDEFRFVFSYLSDRFPEISFSIVEQSPIRYLLGLISIPEN